MTLKTPSVMPLHDEALVIHEQLVGAAAGQQVMEVGDDVGTH